MKERDLSQIPSKSLMQMTTEIVTAFASNNAIESGELPKLIKSVHDTLSHLSQSPTKRNKRPKPPVPISKSVTEDHIICLEDGRQLKMLKRYLKSRYDLTPEEYRERWNLPPDYPMVAPNYAKQRSEFAKEIGLGKSKKSDV